MKCRSPFSGGSLTGSLYYFINETRGRAGVFLSFGRHPGHELIMLEYQKNIGVKDSLFRK